MAPPQTPDRLAAALRYKAHPAPAKPKVKRESVAQAVKEGFSLFPADVQQIAAIRAALASQGRKITASHAVRLALRTVEIDAAKLARMLDEMQAEDGRTRRHQ